MRQLILTISGLVTQLMNRWRTVVPMAVGFFVAVLWFGVLARFVVIRELESAVGVLGMGAPLLRLLVLVLMSAALYSALKGVFKRGDRD